LENYFPSFLKRIKGKMTQEELGKMLGISQSSAGDLLRGKFAPSYEVMQRLTIIYGYNPVAMLTGRGPLRLNEADVAYRLPTELLEVVEKLSEYPDLVHNLVNHIKIAEEYERTKEELKARLQKMKKK
jgi:transcriptional regulator with XRE-family HTH domain